ncbi:MAG: hypothetical protein OEY24_06035 [Candidatus Bathyarchaeota archaeon]|nr:hypothetical protein [Candidatus Bathyarchaeota archaeon]MDH5495246.1 hypothetical protein [Candidatus Bathyarchaeota archaeon]
MKLSKLDWVILVLPFLGIFDVLSTFFVAWRGYPIYLYETGLFASYFAQEGLLHFYVFVYLGILSGIAAVLLFIKREISTGMFYDELLLLLLVAMICFIEAFLTGVIVSNILLGLGRLSLDGLLWLIYLSVFVAILMYTGDELKELFGFGVNGEE